MGQYSDIIKDLICSQKDALFKSSEFMKNLLNVIMELLSTEIHFLEFIPTPYSKKSSELMKEAKEISAKDVESYKFKATLADTLDMVIQSYGFFKLNLKS
jgi:hypothetical protein